MPSRGRTTTRYAPARRQSVQDVLQKMYREEPHDNYSRLESLDEQEEEEYYYTLGEDGVVYRQHVEQEKTPHEDEKTRDSDDKSKNEMQCSADGFTSFKIRGIVLYALLCLVASWLLKGGPGSSEKANSGGDVVWKYRL